MTNWLDTMIVEKDFEDMHAYIEKEIELQLPLLTPCTYEYMQKSMNFEGFLQN